MILSARNLSGLIVLSAVLGAGPATAQLRSAVPMFGQPTQMQQAEPGGDFRVFGEGSGPKTPQGNALEEANEPRVPYLTHGQMAIKRKVAGSNEAFLDLSPAHPSDDHGYLNIHDAGMFTAPDAASIQFGDSPGSYVQLHFDASAGHTYVIDASVGKGAATPSHDGDCTLTVQGPDQSVQTTPCRRGGQHLLFGYHGNNDEAVDFIITASEPEALTHLVVTSD
jgi:hypothetical protein